MKLVGLVGYIGSGKTSIARFLETRGYTRVSLSDFVIEEAKRRALPVTRHNLQEVGNAMRKESGGSVLMELALAKARARGGSWVVIDGLRNPEEARALRNAGGIIVGVTRSGPAGRGGEAAAVDSEDAALSRESSPEEPSWGQQVAQTLQTADVIIPNEDGLEQLYETVEETIGRKMPEHFHDYYMSIAEAVSLGADCLGRRVGSILVRENRIVSTGYNGTPEQIKNCTEGGCERCDPKVKADSGIEAGEFYDVCLCVHAEENALITAARFGLTVEGSTLYTTLQPCFICMRELLQAKIRRVYYREAWSHPGKFPWLITAYDRLKTDFAEFRQLKKAT